MIPRTTAASRLLFTIKTTTVYVVTTIKAREQPVVKPGVDVFVVVVVDLLRDVTQ